MVFWGSHFSVLKGPTYESCKQGSLIRWTQVYGYTTKNWICTSQVHHKLIAFAQIGTYLVVTMHQQVVRTMLWPTLQNKNGFIEVFNHFMWILQGIKALRLGNFSILGRNHPIENELLQPGGSLRKMFPVRRAWRRSRWVSGSMISGIRSMVLTWKGIEHDYTLAGPMCFLEDLWFRCFRSSLSRPISEEWFRIRTVKNTF